MERLILKVFALFLAYVPEFIKGISMFSVRGDRDSKLRCSLPYAILSFIFYFAIVLLIRVVVCLITFLVAFKIYDIDNDGFISNGELFQVLKLMVGSNLKDAQLQQVCSCFVKGHGGHL